MSVRDVDEARVALAHGVVFVDAKEPRNGPLGAVPDPVLRAIAGLERDPRVVLSAACGELLEADLDRCGRVASWAPLCKLGLAAARGRPWGEQLRQWQRRLADVAPDASLVPAAYVDHDLARSPAPRAVLEWAAGHGAPYLLLDTWDKRRGRLTTWLGGDELGALLERAAGAGVRVVLAGSVQPGEIAALAGLGPAVIGVRGAVCRGGDRAAGLDADRLRAALETLGRTVHSSTNSPSRIVSLRWARPASP